MCLCYVKSSVALTECDENVLSGIVVFPPKFGYGIFRVRMTSLGHWRVRELRNCKLCNMNCDDQMNDEMVETRRVVYFFCWVSRTDIPYILLSMYSYLCNDTKLHQLPGCQQYLILWIFHVSITTRT